MPDDQERDLAAFEKRIMEAVERHQQSRGRSSPAPPDRRKEKQYDSAENPLELPSRHRTENAARHEERLRAIPDAHRRAVAKENVEKYYEAWSRALKKAYAIRYDLSPRIYERSLADRKIDERLIPRDEKEKMRATSIREAVAISHNRMRDINQALPTMIDNVLNNAAKYDRVRQLSDNARTRARTGHDKDKEHER